MPDDVDDALRRAQQTVDEGAQRTQWQFLRGLVVSGKALTPDQREELLRLDQKFGKKSRT